ncbi:MAG: carboxypeptidase-like regulatory domain-containing protein [Acidobacteriia bacterium]|nr:carboxypeptidase-like regulatory domain-containing protein [Terriglobia bacterium]
MKGDQVFGLAKSEAMMCTGTGAAPTTRGRRFRTTACLYFLLTASTVLSLSAFGQMPTAAILEGTVRDFSGHVLPGSKLTLENMQTGITRMSLTDSTGRYRFPSLSPGVYRLRVEHPDFQPWQRSEVILNRGDLILINATLDAVVEAGKTNAPSVGTSAEEWRLILPTLAEPMLFVVGVVTARWLLRRLYRAAVLRQMRKQKELSQVGESLSPNHSQAHIEFLDVRGPPQEGLIRANAARRATRRQALGRWVAVALAALVQVLALGLFGGVTFNENPGQPLLQMILSQGRLVLGAALFLLAIVVPGLIRSGQTSAVSWWLFAVPPGVLMGLVPIMFRDSEMRSPRAVVMLLAIVVVLGYGVLVGSLAAVLLAKRLLRVSPEALAFILAGSVGAASNAGVLMLQTGTSLGFWALFVPAEVVILLAPFVAGALTRSRGDPLRLLFLRTFRNAAASDRLLRTVSRTWLTAGEIDAIVGPDIAANTASPEGVLRFATLLIGRHFIRSEADLEKRVHSLAGRPALDGRYEVTEYPCFDNTWKTTMKRLVAAADAILVDVRGYTTTNVGTSYELTSLSELGALERTLLIAGESTPMEVVRAAIEAGGMDGKVPVFRVSDRRSHGEVGAVLFSLATREDREGTGERVLS